MTQPVSRRDGLVAARVASCLKLAAAAGPERVSALDDVGAAFFASRLRGAIEALLATQHHASLVADCAQLGWQVAPFRVLADALSSGRQSPSEVQSDPVAALLSCVRIRADASRASAPDQLDYRLGAAVDYFGAARLLSDADVADARGVLSRRGIHLTDPSFTGLYEALNVELEDINRRRFARNYTWRGRLFHRLIIRPWAEAAIRDVNG